MRRGPRLFGTSGIRGPYPEAVNPALAYKVGLALARMMRGPINIGMDSRKTSPALAYAAAAGAMAGGSTVRFVGQAPTPVLAYSVRSLGSSGGVMVTASHNPPGDNGLKIFESTGMELRSEGEAELEKLMEREELVEWREVGSCEDASGAAWLYLEELSRRLMERPIGGAKVIVDCANGLSSLYTPTLLERAGFTVMTTNCNVDPLFAGRYPEPRKDVLEAYVPLLKHFGAVALFAHDGDADRLSVLTPRRGFVKQDYIIALIAARKLEEKRGEVIVSVDVGNSVKRVVEERGGRLVFARLGKTHEKLLEHPNALLAAEPWKLIDPSWGPWPDAIYQAALLGELIAEGGDLDRLLDGVPSFNWARGSIEFANHSEKEVVFEAVANELLAKYESRGRTLEIDGLRIDLEDDSWFLVRPSGTERKLRYYIESPSAERLRDLEEEITSMIRDVASLMDAKILGTTVDRGS
ncbi:MAG: hypothetical protein QXU52_01110 [Fervidicoccaceae archaeon]